MILIKPCDNLSFEMASKKILMIYNYSEKRKNYSNIVILDNLYNFNNY